jgi:phenylpropionate dioxygenase-like ring-hydroxylating dioxygenase large terminal subunit
MGFAPLQERRSAMQFTPAFETLIGGCRDAVLLNDWHVVALSSEVMAGELVPTTLFERALVVWRDDAGEVHVWDDLCLHRGARLSKGFIQDDRVVCPYHGWNYDQSAQCVLMPAAPHERR